MPFVLKSTGLPIEPALPAIRDALARNPYLVVDAPPGAGKSTVLPLALLSAPWLAGRRIVMLEPRRLATRAVARRMAALLGETLGNTVGYRMRLDVRTSDATRIEVVTEGILTRMLQDDPALEEIGCVIFDEFHERSLQADLGLALVLDAQAALREDLRIVLMSATIDTAALAGFLGEAPIVTVEGRAFPVETHHARQPLGERIASGVAAAVRRALPDTEGDMLVFLPGVGEITRVRHLLEEGSPLPNVRVVPLYGDLPGDQQDLAIEPSPAGWRKIVLATSIAETSLTIEGVRVVIDSGLARRTRFDPRAGMGRLETRRVSRAGADQRRGRAGRLGPGVCHRLWTLDADRTLAPFTPPEILEADLAPLALELGNWGAADATQLRWLTPPPAAPLAQARDLLVTLGAVDPGGRITQHGRAMARLGLHPRLGHMILKANAVGRSSLACDIAAVLGERDIFRARGAMATADLRDRMEALWYPDHRAGGPVAQGVRERVRRLAAGWQRTLGNTMPDGSKRSRPQALAEVGPLLAYAYPDRIGRARGAERGRYVLSGGRGAYLSAEDPLAGEEFLVVADLDAGEREARIYLAAPITLQILENEFASDVKACEIVAWDPRSEAVVARREWRLGELVLREAPLDRAAPDRAVAAMLEGVRELGLGCLPWDREARQWQARVEFLRRLARAGNRDTSDETHAANPPTGEMRTAASNDSGAAASPRRLGSSDARAGLPQAEDFPPVSDASLLANLDRWLEPWLAGITRREHLARLDLQAALSGLLTRDQQRRLEELAPTHIAVPSGSRIALDYLGGEQPVLAVRLQEIFGLRDTPRVARGRAPVTLHILSPARRPVQVTQDLASFWARGYHEVRKELKARYPKHYWPEDPHSAQPTRRTRPSRG